MPETLGAAIKRLREQRGLTQTDLANKAKLSLSTIQKLELNLTQQIRRGNYIALAEAFGISTHQLDQEWKGSIVLLTIPFPSHLIGPLDELAKAMKKRPEDAVVAAVEKMMESAKHRKR